MIDQTLVVDKILRELKDTKIATSTVEKEIDIAAGYLWKVKKGRKHLSEDKLKLLQDYHEKHCKHTIKAIKPVILNLPSPQKNITSIQAPMIIDITTTPVKKGSLASFLGPRPKVESSYKRVK